MILAGYGFDFRILGYGVSFKGQTPFSYMTITFLICYNLNIFVIQLWTYFSGGGGYFCKHMAKGERNTAKI